MRTSYPSLNSLCTHFALFCSLSKGKGVVGGSTVPSIYSQLQQQGMSSSENGGLDYPKIHSSGGSVTPVCTPTPAIIGGVSGGGMDLSPPSKRIKGFSPSSSSSCGGSILQTTTTTGSSSNNMGYLGTGRKSTSYSHSHQNTSNSANHLQDFETSHLLSGHHPSVLVGKSKLELHPVQIYFIFALRTLQNFVCTQMTWQRIRFLAYETFAR